MVPKAISLLGKAAGFLAEGPQQELLDVMLSQFNSVKTDNIGSLDTNGGRLTLGKPIKLPYTFQYPGAMSKPFDYTIRIDVSHETGTSAGGYFHETGNYGGNIVIVIDQAKLVSEEGIATGVLVHEAVHLLSHLQRAVSERIGAREASVIPGTQAAKILDPSSFGPFKKKFAVHFHAVKDFLNSQPHRKDAFNQISDTIIDDWNRKVIEETIAYVYATRTSMAISQAKMSADKRKGPKVGVAVGFVPMEFLKKYVNDFWLTDKDDQKAMATEKGKALLSSMSDDMTALHQAIEAQVGPDKEMA